MQWVGYAELASAVSNAGGLGILTALTQPSGHVPLSAQPDLTRIIQQPRRTYAKKFDDAEP